MPPRRPRKGFVAPAGSSLATLRKPRARNNTALTLVSGKRAQRAEIITQPSVRAYMHWTPAHLQVLQVTADNGDLFRLGDLCDQIIADDRVDKLLEDLAGGVLGCDLTFEKNARTTLGDAEKADELEADWPIGWSEDEIGALLGWMMVVGVGFARHERWIDHEGRVVPKLVCWHPKHFRYDWELYSWMLRDENGNETPIRSGDGEWIILTRKGDYRPWANGLWRGLARWWLLKAYAIQDWGVHSEKASKLVLEAGEGAEPEDRKQLANDIFNLAKDAVISLPAGFKMSLIELSANTREIYQAQIEAAEMGMTLAILGQNLTSMVEGGSYAAANTHERKELRVVRYAAKKLGRGLQEQSFPIWAEFNFGDRTLAPYPKWQVDPPEDKGAKVDTLGKMGTALVSLQSVGLKMPLTVIEEEYGIKGLEEMSAAEKAALNPVPEPAAGGAGGTGAAGGAGGANKGKGSNVTTLRPRAPGTRLLATGEDHDHEHDQDVERTRGMVNGQLYVDRLAEESADEAAANLHTLVERLTNAVDGAQSYGEARRAILKAFEDEEDPDRLASIMEAGIVMANLAGRLAVREDEGEDPERDDDPDGDPDQPELKWNSGQPRVPRGSSSGGQFSRGGAGGGAAGGVAQSRGESDTERKMREAREKIAARLAKKARAGQVPKAAPKPAPAPPAPPARAKPEGRKKKTEPVEPKGKKKTPEPAKASKTEVHRDGRRVVDDKPAVHKSVHELAAGMAEVDPNGGPGGRKARKALDDFVQDELGLPRDFSASRSSLRALELEPHVGGHYSAHDGEIAINRLKLPHAKRGLQVAALGLELSHEEVRGAHTLVHETIHAHGPTHRQSYYREGRILEEAVTETLARRATSKLLGIKADFEGHPLGLPEKTDDPREPYRVQSRSYDHYIAGIMYSVKTRTGWSFEKVDEEMHSASHSYKKRAVGLFSSDEAREHWLKHFEGKASPEALEGMRADLKLFGENDQGSYEAAHRK